MTVPTSTHARVLVTGGAGFIGSNFVHHLFHTHAGVDPTGCCPDHERYDTLDDAPDLEVLNVDKLTYAGDRAHLEGVDDADGYRFEQADICEAETVERLFDGFEPDAVVHFAAESHVDRSIESGTEFVRTNVLGTQILLDAARRHEVDSFLHVSTDEVYGSIEEGSFVEDDPYDPSSPYSASKAGSDLLALAHHRTYGLPVTITRCTNNYGPRQHPEKLLPKIITLAMADEELPIYGDGMNVRDWLYVKDHCTALEHVLEHGETAEIYNVSGDNELPNLEIVEMVLDRLDKPEDLITFVEDRPGHDFRYSLDDSKLRGLGWEPEMPLEEGLDRMIEYVRTREERTMEVEG